MSQPVKENLAEIVFEFHLPAHSAYLILLGSTVKHIGSSFQHFKRLYSSDVRAEADLGSSVRMQVRLLSRGCHTHVGRTLWLTDPSLWTQQDDLSASFLPAPKTVEMEAETAESFEFRHPHDGVIDIQYACKAYKGRKGHNCCQKWLIECTK